MENKFKPYVAVEKSIYYSDGVEEVFICTFDHNNTAETVSILLNDAYESAYQDGLNASVKEKHKELIDKIISLSIQNSRLRIILNEYEVN